MARKTAGYKEPASYFNDSMKKAEEKWDKENAKKPAVKKPAPATGKKKK